MSHNRRVTIMTEEEFRRLYGAEILYLVHCGGVPGLKYNPKRRSVTWTGTHP